SDLVQRGRRQPDDEPVAGARGLRDPGRAPPGLALAAARFADHTRGGPAGPRPALRAGLRPDPDGARLAAAPLAGERAARHGPVVPGEPGLGGRDPEPAREPVLDRAHLLPQSRWRLHENILSGRRGTQRGALTQT